MSDFVIHTCEIHGTATTEDANSQRIYIALTEECISDNAADNIGHTHWHETEMHSCWACCDVMRVGHPGETYNPHTHR
jgi:hypothetical protein